MEQVMERFVWYIILLILLAIIVAFIVATTFGGSDASGGIAGILNALSGKVQPT